jgi:hypothetical protein
MEMEKERLLERIEVNPKVMAGKPVIKGDSLDCPLHSQPLSQWGDD